MRKIILLFTVCSVAFSALTAQDNSNTGFYAIDSIQEIDIRFAQDNWQYLLDSLRLNGDGMLLADLEVNGQVYEYVGVRFRKSKAFKPESKRNGLYIKLDYINKNQNIEGHSHIVLSDALRDPSMVREVLGFEIARQYMPAPKANYAQVSINGGLYGLMVNLEPLDEGFLNRNYGSSDGAFFSARPHDYYEREPKGCLQGIGGSLQYDPNPECNMYRFDLKARAGWDDLQRLTRILKEEPGKIEQVLDVDNTLWMLAFNNVLVNLYSYTGKFSDNYHLYQLPSGQFTPILGDLNFAFGSFKNTGVGSDLKLKQLQELDPLLHEDNILKPLISTLLQEPKYRKMYLSHLRRILYDHLVSGKYKQRAEALQRLIQTAFISDPNKYYTFEQFNRSLTETIGQHSRIPGLVQLLEKRADFLKKHKLLIVYPPEIREVKVLGRPKYSSTRVEVFQVQAKVDRLPKRVYLMYRFSEDQPFRSVRMRDDGHNNDGEAQDGIYGATIAPQSGESRFEYYLVAEGQEMISYAPANYMWERYHTTLEELNH